MLTLTLLGYPSAVLESTPVVDFISQKALALVAYLAVEPRPHSREALATLLWGELPPERASSNLRQALHNVQKLLPNALLVNRLSVQWNPEYPLRLDVAALESAAPLSDAEVIGLHQGDFFEGLSFGDADTLEQWILTRREGYRVAYTHRLEQHIQAAYGRRDWPTLEQLVARAIAHDALDERPYRMLWRTLARRGDISNALSSAQTLRQTLDRELGVPPSAETETLERRLRLAQADALHNLPSVSTAFVGREDELRQIGAWLHQPEARLITLTGIGGCGKSRLAREAAAQNARSFINGVRYVPLAPLTSEMYLVSAMAGALGVSLQNQPNPLQVVLEHLAQRELLLLLDNAEHLAGVADLVVQILAAAPDCCVLVTSRQALGLREEWVLPLDGLPVDAPDAPALRLLTQTAAQQGYSLPMDNPAVRRISALLEGLPLGLELAASLLSQVPAAQLADQLTESLDALRSGWLNPEPRHISLRAVFDTSWAALNAARQQALARLSIFAAPFTASAAAAICEVDAGMLRSLMTRSLLRDHGERFSLHPVIQRYARERLGDAAALMRQYAAYYIERLAEAEQAFTARDIPAALALMSAEIDHLRHLWGQAVAARDLLLIERMTHTMHRYYEASALYAEGQAFFHMAADQLALSFGAPQEGALLGRLRAHEAGVLLRLGRVSKALTSAEAAVRALESASAPAEHLAFALNALGIALLYTGQTHAAVDALERCAALYRDLGRVERIKPLINLGSVYTRTGDLDRAQAALQEADALAQQINDRMAHYHIKNGLGTICALRGDLTGALPHLLEAQQLAEQAGFISGQAITLYNRADVHLQLGSPQRAMDLARQALALAQRIHDHRAATYALATLALAQTALRDSTARASLAQALTEAQATQSEPLLLVVLFAGAAWCAAHGHAPLAERLRALVATHPATEADYRRRAGDAQMTGEDSLFELVNLLKERLHYA
jgi:DNA-binding SARP family transcriptional activator/predicted ATPase